jgi:ethanolamine utilization cobalamin adenosyltransferase
MKLLLRSGYEAGSAIERGEKIYITSKTILTPSARDLGEEKDIFARV